MVLVSISADYGYRLGVKTERGIVDMQAALAEIAPESSEAIPHDLRELLLGGEHAWLNLLAYLESTVETAPAAQWLLKESDIEMGPCLPMVGNIICIGLNYRKHAVEAGMEIPEEPILFSKLSNTIAASGARIPLPSNAEQFDYEAELGVVMGRRASHVSETEALDYVFGYCNANDLSARDLQFRSSQWLLGKTLDKFLPIGPYLVTADEVSDPQKLDIRCWVNGDLRQDSNTADMIFTVAQLVSYISQYVTLEAGDLILTGTPSGVVAGRPEKDWLVPGDEVTIEIEGLGRLINPLVR